MIVGFVLAQWSLPRSRIIRTGFIIRPTPRYMRFVDPRLVCELKANRMVALLKYKQIADRKWLQMVMHRQFARVVPSNDEDDIDLITMKRRRHTPLQIDIEEVDSKNNGPATAGPGADLGKTKAKDGSTAWSPTTAEHLSREESVANAEIVAQPKLDGIDRSAKIALESGERAPTYPSDESSRPVQERPVIHESNTKRDFTAERGGYSGDTIGTSSKAERYIADLSTRDETTSATGDPHLLQDQIQNTTSSTSDRVVNRLKNKPLENLSDRDVDLLRTSDVRLKYKTHRHPQHSNLSFKADAETERMQQLTAAELRSRYPRRMPPESVTEGASPLPEVSFEEEVSRILASKHDAKADLAATLQNARSLDGILTEHRGRILKRMKQIDSEEKNITRSVIEDLSQRNSIRSGEGQPGGREMHKITHKKPISYQEAAPARPQMNGTTDASSSSSPKEYLIVTEASSRKIKSPLSIQSKTVSEILASMDISRFKLPHPRKGWLLVGATDSSMIFARDERKRSRRWPWWMLGLGMGFAFAWTGK